jgi:CBS domain-containing protein
MGPLHEEEAMRAIETASHEDQPLDDAHFAFRVHVAEIMSTRLLTAHPDEAVETVRQRLLERGVHHVIVTHRDGELMGMLCACDLEEAWPDARVRDCMSACPLFTGPTESLAAVAATMENFGVGALPIVDTHGELVGIVTRSDLRAHGVLPNQPGVDRCAACGSSHKLCPKRANEPCFCRTCVEVGRSASEDPNVMLGGGD